MNGSALENKMDAGQAFSLPLVQSTRFSARHRRPHDLTIIPTVQVQQPTRPEDGDRGANGVSELSTTAINRENSLSKPQNQGRTEIVQHQRLHVVNAHNGISSSNRRKGTLGLQHSVSVNTVLNALNTPPPLLTVNNPLIAVTAAAAAGEGPLFPSSNVSNGCLSYFFPQTPLQLNPLPPAARQARLVDVGKPAQQGGMSGKSDDIMTVADVDYRLPHPSRPLEVKVEGRSLYVNPHLLQDICPLLTRFMVREMVAGKRHSMETQLEQLSYADVLEVLQVLCPTEMGGLFPKAVKKDNFPTLIRMAADFRIEKLRLYCEQFVLRLPLTVADVSKEELIHFFSLSLYYQMGMLSKTRLLAGLLAISNSIQLPSMKTSTTSRDAVVIHPLACSIFPSAYQLYSHGGMMHSPNPPTEPAKLKVPCSYCRMEPPIDESLMAPRLGLPPMFRSCKSCHATVCNECASRMPCLRTVESLLRRKALELASSQPTESGKDLMANKRID